MEIISQLLERLFLKYSLIQYLVSIRQCLAILNLSDQLLFFPSVQVYLYFSRFTFLIATIVKHDAAQKREKKLAQKKQY